MTAAAERSLALWRHCRVGVLVAGLLAGTVACSSDASGSAPPSRTEIADLLARHGAAVRDHDRDAFLSGLAPGRFRTQQSAAFDNLSRLPLASWSYRLGPRVGADDAQRAARKKHGASAVIVRVELRYALRGIDAKPTSHDVWWTVVRRAGKPVVVADTDLSRAGGVSWRGPWDFGRLDIVRGRSGLVIGHPADAALDRQVSATIDQAVPVVTTVWGTAWTRRVAAVVPASRAELEAALGPAAGITTEIGAIAQADSQDVVTGKPVGQRVVVVADELQRLSAVGRRVVLQHEITHLATAARTTSATPRWLAEGFAEYVGNLGSGQPVRVAAAELAADVRRGNVPTRLPDDARFDASGSGAQSYQSAWLACRLIAAHAGQAGLVRFYRAVGGSAEPSDTAVAVALRSIVGMSPQQFRSAWRSYLREQLT